MRKRACLTQTCVVLQFYVTYDLYIAAFAGAGITLLALVSDCPAHDLRHWKPNPNPNCSNFKSHHLLSVCVYDRHHLQLRSAAVPGSKGHPLKGEQLPAIAVQDRLLVSSTCLIVVVCSSPPSPKSNRVGDEDDPHPSASHGAQMILLPLLFLVSPCKFFVHFHCPGEALMVPMLLPLVDVGFSRVIKKSSSHFNSRKIYGSYIGSVFGSATDTP